MKVTDTGECIHYFYRKKAEPKEESPGISLHSQETSHFPTPELDKCKALAKKLSFNKSCDEPTALPDKNCSNLQLRGVVSIAIWLQGQRAVTNFISLENRWTALTRIYLGTIENANLGG